jgi:hypothetical protein
MIIVSMKMAHKDAFSSYLMHLTGERFRGCIRNRIEWIDYPRVIGITLMHVGDVDPL